MLVEEWNDKFKGKTNFHVQGFVQKLTQSLRFRRRGAARNGAADGNEKFEDFSGFFITEISTVR